MGRGGRNRRRRQKVGGGGIKLDDMPNELLAGILRRVGCRTRTQAATCVCRRWRALALDNVLMGGRSCFERGEASPQATATVTAAERGHLACLAEMPRRIRLYDPGACTAAACGGHLDCLMFLHTAGCPRDVSTTLAAFLHGRLDCLEFLEAQKCFGATRRCIDVLRDYGPTDCIDCIDVTRPRPCEYAIVRGHVKCLDYLVRSGLPLPVGACHSAAWHGHLNCLIFAREHGCLWDATVCENAAEAGQLALLRYLHEHGCPWDERTCEAAATKGRAECLRYAVEHGCPIDRRECIRDIRRLDTFGGDCDRCFECGWCRQSCRDERRLDCLFYLERCPD